MFGTNNHKPSPNPAPKNSHGGGRGNTQHLAKRPKLITTREPGNILKDLE